METAGVLAAAADPSRLRLLALLRDGEAAVAELTAVLGQSQPRVSRHLRILQAAGLVDHFREGRWVYYRIAPGLAGAFMPWLTGRLTGDAVVMADRARMAGLRRQREHQALRGVRRLGGPAGFGDVVPGELLDAALGGAAAGEVLDIGSGTGTVLCQLARRARRAVGLDAAPGMRVIARARLREAGLAGCTVRAGDAHALPFADRSFDGVVVDEVLRTSADPARVLAEAARVLRADGCLLVLDHILPAVRRLPADAAPDALYENEVAALAAIGRAHV